MSDVSPTPRLGVAEATGEECCYRGRYRSNEADGHWDRLRPQEMPEWVEVVIVPNWAEPERTL